MPRRKGYGIPPTKRIKVDRANTNQKNITLKSNQGPNTATSVVADKLINDSHARGISSSSQGPIKRSCVIEENEEAFLRSSECKNKKSENGVPSSLQPIASNSKYLHKKFKKMASTNLSSDEVTPEKKENILLPISSNNNNLKNEGVLGTVSSNNTTSLDTDKIKDDKKLNINNNESDSFSDNYILPLKIKNATSDSSDSTKPEPSSKRYKCSYCDLPCLKPSVLQKHERAHTNERPFPCKECGIAFKTNSNYLKHCRSKTHKRKLVELGLADSSSCEDNLESSFEDDNSSIHSDISVCNNDNNISNKEVTNLEPAVLSLINANNDKPQKTIYKPKFHTASKYLDNHSNDNKKRETEIMNKAEDCQDSFIKESILKLKIPSSSITNSGSTLSLANGSSPSPEYLQQHITKLINDNQAIVEKSSDPLWPKKYLHRSNSKDKESAGTNFSLISPKFSFSDISVKRYANKSYCSSNIVNDCQNLISSDYNNKDPFITNDDFNNVHEKVYKTNETNLTSKLELALLRPNSPPSSIIKKIQPSFNNVSNISDLQPLNLCTSNSNNDKNFKTSKEGSVIHNRKRSYSESFPTANEPGGSYDIDNQITSFPITERVLNSHSNEEVLNYPNNKSSYKFSKENFSESKAKLLHSAISEGGSLIKDLLLKAGRPLSEERASIYHISSRPMTSISLITDEKPLMSTKDTKEVNFSKSNENFLKNHLPSSISPPYPSPGPLLGNTPLISNSSCYPMFKMDRQMIITDNDHINNNNNHHKDVNSKTNKTRPPDGDSLSSNAFRAASETNSTLPIRLIPFTPQTVQTAQAVHKINGVSKAVCSTTLHSLEELSKSPIKNNRMFMFGGNVKVMDELINWPKIDKVESLNNVFSENEILTKDKSHSKHVVVTIAQTSLHSGGTIVHLPKTTVVTTNDKEFTETAEVISSQHELSKYQINADRLLVPVTASPTAIPYGSFLKKNDEKNGQKQQIVNSVRLLPQGLNAINPLINITGYNPLTVSPTVVHDPLYLNDRKKFSGSIRPSGTGVVTIYHGGKTIPYVPGMPGPQTLLNTTQPLIVAAVSSTLSSPIEHQSINKKLKINSSSTSKGCLSSIDSSGWNSKTVQTAASTMGEETEDFKNSTESSSVGKSASDFISSGSVTDTDKNHIKSDANSIIQSLVSNCKQLLPSTKNNSNCNQPLTVAPVISIERVNPVLPLTDKEDPAQENKSDKKFLRPTSLLLKPGTFTPKKLTLLNTPSNVLPLVSPETPRPRKSYGQLYLNGHAYTYLGLKCSTRVFFCTLHKPQPIYVPLTPEYTKISMYSNWKICLESEPNTFGLDPGKAMRYYDSRHRPTSYTIAKHRFNQLTLIHSSGWNANKCSSSKAGNSRINVIENLIKEDSSSNCTPLIKTEDNTDGSQFNNNIEEPHPKRVKIFDGGYESNEDYIYIRGRGRGKYVCEECGIRCKKPSMLKKHIRTHTDVRPFGCKHCTFSFKTKGNLTKHMKSKAHYKRCLELGLNPVPITVDDSCIDEELLQKQQAMQADQGIILNNEEEDDEEEDEDEDEDDDEDEEDCDGDNYEEDEDKENTDKNEDNGEKAENYKRKLEREAACSLISLSESTGVPSTSAINSSQELMIAGLINFNRPSTYPYSFFDRNIEIREPNTPTLFPMTAEREREKVSQNTGLARDLGIEKLQTTLCPAQKPVGRLEGYYFPSVHSKLLTNQTSEDIQFSQGSEKNVSSVKSEVAMNTSDDNNTKKSISDQKNVSSSVPIEVAAIKSVGNLSNVCLASKNNASSDDPSTPIDLSNSNNKIIAGDNCSGDKLNSISQAVTCEAAVLLASLYSTVNTLTISKGSSSMDISPNTANDENGQNNPLLQAYITERAVKQQTIKLHQSCYNIHEGSRAKDVDKHFSSDFPTIKMVPSKNKLSSSNITDEIPLNINDLSNKNLETNINASPPPPSKMHTIKMNPFSENSVSSSTKSSTPSTSSNNFSSISDLPQTPHSMSAAKENALDILAQTSLASDIAKKQFKLKSVVINNDSSSGSPKKKLKAEFIQPSNDPSPSYVSMLDDGRSMCTICNKIFTKPSQMKLHVNIHYFERPYKCESCSVSFRLVGHYQKHMRSVSHLNKINMNSTFGTATSSNPRPFKCNDCKVAFRIHGHLAKHLRSKMHIMKLECLGKLPFGTYAEMERSGINMNDIDTTDCENSLESLQLLAQKLYGNGSPVSKLEQGNGNSNHEDLTADNLAANVLLSDSNISSDQHNTPQHFDKLNYIHQINEGSNNTNSTSSVSGSIDDNDMNSNRDTARNKLPIGSTNVLSGPINGHILNKTYEKRSKHFQPYLGDRESILNQSNVQSLQNSKPSSMKSSGSGESSFLFQDGNKEFLYKNNLTDSETNNCRAGLKYNEDNNNDHRSKFFKYKAKSEWLKYSSPDPNIMRPSTMQSTVSTPPVDSLCNNSKLDTNIISIRETHSNVKIVRSDSNGNDLTTKNPTRMDQNDNFNKSNCDKDSKVRRNNCMTNKYRDDSNVKVESDNILKCKSDSAIL